MLIPVVFLKVNVQQVREGKITLRSLTSRCLFPTYLWHALALMVIPGRNNGEAETVSIGSEDSPVFGHPSVQPIHALFGRNFPLPSKDLLGFAYVADVHLLVGRTPFNESYLHGSAGFLFKHGNEFE